jgi:hypothetical protein
MATWEGSFNSAINFCVKSTSVRAFNREILALKRNEAFSAQETPPGKAASPFHK